MADAPVILLIVFAAVLILGIPLEGLYTLWRGLPSGFKTLNDSISSLASTLMHGVGRFANVGIAVISYEWLLGAISMTSLSASSLSTWIFYILVADFSSYLFHRLNHSYHFLWGIHQIHHTSNEFNYTTALRQQLTTEIVNYQALFLIPCALLGVPLEVVVSYGIGNSIFQYLYHTVTIGKLGWLEYIFITPSQHRVHHAMNREYVDKNFGAIFTWWDRLFGTFQEELDDVKPVYGISKPLNTYNPLVLDFSVWGRMIKDTVRTRSLANKFRLWFKPVNWRPDDVAQNDPWDSVDDVYRFEKYDPKAPFSFSLMSMMELAFLVAYLAFFVTQLSAINTVQSLIMAGLILTGIALSTERLSMHKPNIMLLLLYLALSILVCTMIPFDQRMIMIEGVSLHNIFVAAYGVSQVMFHVYAAFIVRINERLIPSDS